MTATPRVLLVAHHANPEWGSEPLIGWQWAKYLDRQVGLELVTHVRNRAAIERAGGLRRPVHYIDTERLAQVINRWNDRLWPKHAPVNRHILDLIALRAFDRAACRIAADAARDGRIDIIHRVSPISPRHGTRLHRCGLPLVIGPLNGGMRTAPGFREIARREKEIFLKLRSLATALDPTRRDLAAAAAVLVANETTRAALPKRLQRRAHLICENAVDLQRFPAAEGRRPGPFRVLYLGRLLAYKGVEYLLRAAAQAMTRTPIEVTITGDGPERQRLAALASELGIADRTTFTGACPVTEVPARMADADVFVLPSVRESGGAVLLEAMATGRPVITVAWGGPAETVRPEVGIAITPRGPDDLIADLARAIVRLASDPGRAAEMGRRARRHVERHYTWDRRVEQAMAVYSSILEPARHHAHSPLFDLGASR